VGLLTAPAYLHRIPPDPIGGVGDISAVGPNNFFAIAGNGVLEQYSPNPHLGAGVVSANSWHVYA
jgi:hypothetical protein